MNTINEFKIERYQQERPFASFLSGISGKKGIPMWAFYVNRGQGMASFGLRDKNGVIMGFFQACSSRDFTRTLLKEVTRHESKNLPFRLWPVLHKRSR